MMIRVGRARTVRRAGALLVLLVLVAGCGGNGSGEAEPEESPSPSESASESGVDQSRKFQAKVHAEGTGAAEFTWDGQQEIVLTRVGGPDIDVNLLSAGFTMPQVLDSDRAFRFRWAFDLLNAYEDKPATFEITGDAVNAQGLKSSAFLIWMKVKDPSKDVVFDMAEVDFLKEFKELKEPCTVEVGENESTGTLRCPALAAKDGEVAGLTVTWEEIPE